MKDAVADELEQVLEQWRPRLLQQNPDQMAAKPDATRWSIAEVIGHLVDSANNNHQRFVRAQFCDKLIFPKYEQNQWVSAVGYVGADWKRLVELWYYYNLQIADIIRKIDDGSLETSCEITPYEPCTLGFLVSDYLDHLKHHLTILEQRLASGGA